MCTSYELLLVMVHYLLYLYYLLGFGTEWDSSNDMAFSCVQNDPGQCWLRLLSALPSSL
jgi:hypothetical protein